VASIIRFQYYCHIDSDDITTINMVVALLVLILERTQMIGILKALANNWSIRKIFLYNASYLILRGLLWGMESE
jgi:lipoprotein-releasing system permease protein